MLLSASPTWVWLGTAAVAVAVLGVVAALLWEFARPRPVWSAKAGATKVEVWLRAGRRAPGADLVIVPVSEDAELARGSARWVRDSTAGMAQRIVDSLPRESLGGAYIGEGARYRFRLFAAAVVLDGLKRFTPDGVRAAVARAIGKTRDRRVDSVLIPDWSSDLAEQPRSGSDASRRKTAEILAPALAAAVNDVAGQVSTVRIWVNRKGLEDVYIDALRRQFAA